MRLFIAIPVPPDIRRTASETAGRLRACGAEGRFTEPKNYHVTLRFLGETDALNDVVTAMHSAVRDASPFLLRLGEYDTFKPRGEGSPRTAVLTLRDESGELKQLLQSLDAALWESGFSLGKATYSPHITLGRSVTGDEGFTAQFREAFTVDRLVLYESRMEKEKLVYLPLHRESLL